MVTTTQDEILAEVAEAEAAGLKAEDIATVSGQIATSSDMGGLGLAYQVPDPDKAAWIAAWKLSVGLDGIERGYPVKLAKQAVGMYLSKRREDGGRLFSLKMPAHLQPPPKFKCFVGDGACRGRYATKNQLLDHIYAAHPKESKHLEPELKIIRDSAVGENVALRDIINEIAATPDRGPVPVPESVRAAYDATLPPMDTTPPVMETISVRVKCDLCPWPQGAAKWANSPPSPQALKMHIFAKHRNDTE